MARTVEKGRSAETGQFVPIDYAKKHPKTTVIEKVIVGPPKRRILFLPFSMCLDDVNRLSLFMNLSFFQ